MKNELAIQAEWGSGFQRSGQNQAAPPRIRAITASERPSRVGRDQVRHLCRIPGVTLPLVICATPSREYSDFRTHLWLSGDEEVPQFLFGEECHVSCH